MANVPTLMVRQQTAQNWVVTNTGQLWIGTHGRGMWSSNTLMQPMGNNEPSPFGNNTIPVFKNSVKVFPNPMNDNGNVSFLMPGAGEAYIEIYSINGKRVQRMDLGKISAGSYTREFDAGELSKGTYFIAVVAHGQKGVAKFVKID